MTMNKGGILTSRRAPKRQCRAKARTDRQRGPGSRRGQQHSNGLNAILTYSVGADADLASLLVLDEPSPTAALDAGKSGVHLGLELAEATVGGVNGLGEGTGGGLTTTSALGGKVLPEQRVVKVTTAVEVDGGLESDLGGNVALVLGFLELHNGVVVVGDVGVVVVLVVNLHDLTGDGGLQSTVVVLLTVLVHVFSGKAK